MSRGIRRKARVTLPKTRWVPWRKEEVFHYGPARILQAQTQEAFLERMAKQGIVGTLPERLVYAALERRGVPFEFQSSVMGGKARRGGAVVDFLLPTLNVGLEVKGDYWHRNEAHDMTREAELLEVAHIRIVTIWDWETYDLLLLDSILDTRVFFDLGGRAYAA